MKNKKTDKANLEKKRGVFLQIGLIIAFSAVLYAFEWTTPDLSYNKTSDIVGLNIEVETVPITRIKKIKPPPPKHYKKIKIVKTIKISEKEVLPENIYLDPDEPVYLDMPEIIEKISENETKIHILPQVMPRFPGGIASLKKYIVKNVKYPKKARDADIEGKVYVRFVINLKGKIEQASIIRGVDPILNKEALRVVKSFPKWTPGLQNGKPVNVWFTVPIVFQLQK